MPISSLIVRTKADEAKDVCSLLSGYQHIGSAEVHDESIIVITETKDRAEDKQLWDSIEGTPGVLQCDLIYHNFEDVEDSGNE